MYSYIRERLRELLDASPPGTVDVVLPGTSFLRGTISVGLDSSVDLTAIEEGASVCIGDNSTVYGCKLGQGSTLVAGNNVLVHNCSFPAHCKVYIGDNVKFLHVDVQSYTPYTKEIRIGAGSRVRTIRTYIPGGSICVGKDSVLYGCELNANGTIRLGDRACIAGGSLISSGAFIAGDDFLKAGVSYKKGYPTSDDTIAWVYHNDISFLQGAVRLGNNVRIVNVYLYLRTKQDTVIGDNVLIFGNDKLPTCRISGKRVRIGANAIIIANNSSSGFTHESVAYNVTVDAGARVLVNKLKLDDRFADVRIS